MRLDEGRSLAEFQPGGCSPELVTALLAHGADPNAPGRGARSPYRLALRTGRAEVADLLARHGAADDATAADRLLAACLRADRGEATRLVAAEPALADRWTEDDGGALAHAADHGDTEAVTLMLDLGFPVNGRSGDDGATALHAAAAAGSPEVVRLLVERGADLEAPDGTWQSPPLDWAVIGSGLRLGHNPTADWVVTVRTLIEAGASVENLSWTDDKPPSAEVAAVLLPYGIGPSEPS